MEEMPHKVVYSQPFYSPSSSPHPPLPPPSPSPPSPPNPRHNIIEWEVPRDCSYTGPRWSLLLTGRNGGGWGDKGRTHSLYIQQYINRNLTLCSSLHPTDTGWKKMQTKLQNVMQTHKGYQNKSWLRLLSNITCVVQ